MTKEKFEDNFVECYDGQGNFSGYIDPYTGKKVNLAKYYM